MELLRFTDVDGREWEVWEVGARPLPADRVAPEPVHGRAPERWLCFESGTERRRLLTYPSRWHAMSPRELAALCRTASPNRVILPLPSHEQPRQPDHG